MKIVLNVFPLLRPRTGIGIYTGQLVKHLLRIDKKNEYLFYYGKYFSREVIETSHGPRAALKEGEREVPVWLAKGRHHLKDAFFLTASSALRCRLYHELNYLPLPFLGRTVVTVHDLSLALFPETHPRDRLEIWRAKFPGRLRKADHVIAISESTKCDLIRLYGVSPEKISVVYYGRDPAFRPLPRDVVEEALQRMGIDFPYILYVGAIEPRKNIRGLLDAFRILKSRRPRLPHKLVLGGPLAWKSEGILRFMEESAIPYFVRGEGGEGGIGAAEVFITGYMPNEMIPLLMNGTDLFVYPSLYEGFGLPPLEAMACGRPVITSDVSSLPEVVGSAAVTVPPEDSERLAAEMERILEDRQLGASLGERGIRRAERFSWEDCAEKVLEIYARVGGTG